MEAVPRLPMLSFELKTSDKHPNFAVKLKNYIQNYYSEDGESFSSQIAQLEALRASATRPSIDVAGCSTLKRYFCQLHFMRTRFPMGRDGEAAVKFSWKGPYNYGTLSATDIILEQTSIMYNIGALHSQLGAADNRTSSDGIKMACTHFQCAAGAFQYISDEMPQLHCVDNSTNLLIFLNSICLAQAQECILEKSMLDNRKSTIIAKVAVQTVEFYRLTLKRLKLDEEVVSSKLRKKWENYLKFKIEYHGSIGLLYQGQQAEEEQKSGERVAYYEYALEKLEDSRKLSKNLDHIEPVNEALQFTHDVIERKLKAAKNENEFVYHEKVPEILALPEVKGACLVKGIGFSINDPEVSGPDIFARLIPIKAHETSSIYSEELAELLRNITAQISQADHDLVGFLSTLELDNPIRASQELPQKLIDSCAALSARPDAVDELLNALSTLSETYRDVEAILTEIRTLLEQEEKEALHYQDVVGKRPPSIAATDLTREAKKYWDAHTKASESNYTLRNAIQMHSENLQLLLLPPRQLERQIPSVTVDDAEDQSVFATMDTLLQKIEEMKAQRSMLIGQLRESINRDDITQKVVTFSGTSKEELFEKEKSKHQSIVNHIGLNISAQAKIIAALQDAYPRFSMSRRKVAENLNSRNGIIQSLIAAYEAYDDLIAKSHKGIDFYQKLYASASKLLQRVKSTCTVQQEERVHILSNITETVEKHHKNHSSNLANSSTGSTLKLKDYLNMQKETGKLSLSSGPTQTPTWVPGIRPAPVGSEGNDSIKAVPFDTGNIPYYSNPPATIPVTSSPAVYYPTYNYTPYADNMQQPYSIPSYAPQQPYHPDPAAYPMQTGYSNYYGPENVIPPSAYYGNESNPMPTPTPTPTATPIPTPYYENTSTPYYGTETNNIPMPATSVAVAAPSPAPAPVEKEPAGVYPYMYNPQFYAYPPGSDYTPQQYQQTGYLQGTEYLQYGNTTLYTQTQQPNPYTPTSSQVYMTEVAPQQPSTEQWSTYTYASGQSVNKVTYQQADGYSTTNLTSSSSANGIMASPSVAASNVDLLAGLDFEVAQAPLTANTVDVVKPSEPEKKFQPEKKPLPATVKQPTEEKLDVESVKQLVPEVEKLEKLVESLTLKTLGGPTMLDIKWKEIMDAQEKDGHTRSISVARCYPMKNRFPDILPYDDSRIELPSTKDDYINASFIKPVTSGMAPIILTQSPLPVTYADFWAMVAEQQVEVIVCLLSDSELSEKTGGHVYWPDNKASDFHAGKIKISLQACNARQHWVERILSVTTLDTKTTRVVVHLQFTAWPNSMFPTSPGPLLAFLREVQVFTNQQRNFAHPTVVHCVAGVGRSGMVVLLLAAITDIQCGRGLPDLVTLCTRISLSRKNSLRDREHLKFAYQALLYFSQDLLLTYGILTNKTVFEDSKEKKSHARHPSQDFLVEMNQVQAKMESLETTGTTDNESDATCAAATGSQLQQQQQQQQQQPSSLLAALDPNQFNLSTSEGQKLNRSRIKFTPDQFAKPSTSLASQNANSDPLSSLDPLWSLKK